MSQFHKWRRSWTVVAALTVAGGCAAAASPLVNRSQTQVVAGTENKDEDDKAIYAAVIADILGPLTKVIVPERTDPKRWEIDPRLGLGGLDSTLMSRYRAVNTVPTRVATPSADGSPKESDSLAGALANHAQIHPVMPHGATA